MKIFISSKSNYTIPAIIKAALSLVGIFIYLVSFQSCAEENAYSAEDEVIAEIQNRLDGSESPQDINSNREFPLNSEYFLGLRYGGGIIISFDSERGTGLIATAQDLQRSTWGCYDNYVEDLPVVGRLSDGLGTVPKEGTRFGDGIINTKIIVESACGKNSAARICDDYVNEGHEDWFLPSIGELSHISIARAHGEYWSSTAKDSTSAAYYFEYYLDRAYGSSGCSGLLCFPPGGDERGRISTESRNVVKDIQAVRAF